MKTYSLRKCKKILIGVYHLLRKKKRRLLPAQEKEIRHDLKALQEEILNKNKEGANLLAHKCQDYTSGILKKRGFEQVRDFIFALIFALAVALVIRQVWFELYEIPTGSMRPTFKEKDRLIVSKTNFGVNLPFTTEHLYFNPDLVKRSGTIVFSAEHLDVHDPDTLYFWIFPGKKQFVKRLMGKPGDTIYFYGGQMYGIDASGNDITPELQALHDIDHVPYIRFQGNVGVSEPFHSPMGNAYRMTVLHQMNEPVARLTVVGNQRLEGEMLYTPSIHNRNAPPVENYYQLWGIGNYANARIVRKEDVRSFVKENELTPIDADFFLELKHHPNLKRLELRRDLYGRLRPQFILSTSILPLDESHLKALFDHLYTARFIVRNGFARSYGMPSPSNSHNLTRLEGVPDGMYEFFNGQGYKIKWLGVSEKLAQDHPLMTFSADRVRKLFNYGINFHRHLALGPHFDTARFAYFRDGDLYLLGAPIFKKNETVLEDFIRFEQEKGDKANIQVPYIPFIDQGPPLTKEGKIDEEKIKHFGLLIPPKGYLALGDNFANSGDSRDFGFVPQGNLRGAPSFIFWPFGSRFGPPNQPPYPWLTLPNLIVWTIAGICFIFWYLVHRRYHRLPLKDL